MNKKILVVALALAMLALPMISTAQAVKGGIPTENYDDVQIWGYIIPVEDATDVYVQGNVQYGRYNAHCVNFMTGLEWIAIFWGGTPMVDAQVLMGTATYEVEYKVNLNTMNGVARLKTVITLPGGTFEGEVLWNGEFGFRSDYANTLDVVSILWHNSFRGTGAYDGWKIQMVVNGIPWGNGAQEGFVGSGHLIKPLTIA